MRSVGGAASIRCTRATAVAALSLCALLFSPIASAKPPAGHGTALRSNHKQAADKALEAFGSSEGSDPVIVFGLPKPLRAGTRRTAGATRRAPLIGKVDTDGTFFFYEDSGPFQFFQHLGRVALVAAKSGKVAISQANTWPLLAGKLPAFLTSSKRYRSSKYHVFYRSAAPASQADGPLFENDPFGRGEFVLPIANEGNTARRSPFVVSSGAPPAVTTSPGCTAYTEQAPAVVVDAQVTASDPDDANLDGGRVRIAANLHGGDDLLFTDQNGIAGSYDDETGVLTLTGTTSVGNYQDALRSVGYRNLASGKPSGTKVIEFTVNDGAGDSVPTTKQICITGSNDPPIGEASEGVLEYAENDGPVPLDVGFVVGDPDSSNLSGATIKFIPVVSQPADENADPVGPPVTTVTFAPDQDELAFVDQKGITGSYSDSTGVLTLSGTASLADYETAIRSITYKNSSEDLANGRRRLEFQVADSSAARSIPSRRDIFITAVARAGRRDIPVGQWGVGNSPIRANNDLLAIRFVIDTPTTMYRFIAPFNLEGVYTDEANAPAPTEIRSRCREKTAASCEGNNAGYPPPPAGLSPDWPTGEGRIGYAHGNGGTIWARVVPVTWAGEPDLSSVLAEEKVNAVQRYEQTKAAFGIHDDELTQLLYFNTGSVQLAAHTPYAVVFTNSHPDPVGNYFSLNLPGTKVSEAGPHETNTTDRKSPGAILGLDPREAVGWWRGSDPASGWVWGHRVGGVLNGTYYYGYYAHETESDDGTRMPWYGWQEGPGLTPKSNQPYTSYGEEGSFTLRAKNVPRLTSLTEAGGYAPVGKNLGAVTVRNVTTGQSASTASLGSGIVKGALSTPVLVHAGDTYEISNTGTALKSEADGYVQRIFGFPSPDWPFETVGHGYDRAELFALPHPYLEPDN